MFFILFFFVWLINIQWDNGTNHNGYIMIVYIIVVNVGNVGKTSR